MQNDCKSRLELAVAKRPVNGLNIEIGTPAARCINKPPVNSAGVKANAFRWLLSGGSELAFGVCCQATCPLREQMAGGIEEH